MDPPRLTPVNDVLTVNVEVVVVVFVVTLAPPPAPRGGRDCARGLGMASSFYGGGGGVVVVVVVVVRGWY